MNKQRTIIGGLSVGALTLASWIAQEGFTSSPTMPREGDKWTIGHGATYYPDTGQPVRKGDAPITREQAGAMARQHLQKVYGPCVKKALPATAKMSQVEYDIAVNFAGQFGCGAWASSSMAAMYAQGRYKEACTAYLAWRNVTSYTRPTSPGWREVRPGVWRFDCATPGNKVCRGVWTRAQWRYEQCTASL